MQIFPKPGWNAKVRVEKMIIGPIWAKFIEGEQNYHKIKTKFSQRTKNQKFGKNTKFNRNFIKIGEMNLTPKNNVFNKITRILKLFSPKS